MPKKVGKQFKELGEITGKTIQRRSEFRNKFSASLAKRHAEIRELQRRQRTRQGIVEFGQILGAAAGQYYSGQDANISADSEIGTSDITPSTQSTFSAVEGTERNVKPFGFVDNTTSQVVDNQFSDPNQFRFASANNNSFNNFNNITTPNNAITPNNIPTTINQDIGDIMKESRRKRNNNSFLFGDTLSNFNTIFKE